MKLSQFKVLTLLARHGNVSGGELARLLGVGLAALSGMIDRLVEQDLETRASQLLVKAAEEESGTSGQA